MAKITIADLEPNQLITVSLTEIVVEFDPDENDPEEDISLEKEQTTNLIGLPKKTA